QRQPGQRRLRFHPDGGRRGRQARQGVRLVRQRVGLLQPHGGRGAARRKQIVAAAMVRSVEQLDLPGKRVFVRVDFNVPIDKKTGAVKDDSRIRAALPTLRYAIGKKAKVILASHLGRPDGKVVPELSLENVGDRLSQLLGQDVLFADDCVGDGVRKLVADMQPGQVLLLENLRFHPEEEKNDD